ADLVSTTYAARLRCTSCPVFILTSIPFYLISVFFFFNAPAPTEIYTLSLHDALPIFRSATKVTADLIDRAPNLKVIGRAGVGDQDRKSTRLNSSHLGISYAVFCLKKKKTYVGDDPGQ